jgi:hypothetical protein
MKEVQPMRMRKIVMLTMALLVAVARLAGCGGRRRLKAGWRGSNVGRRTWVRYASSNGLERASFPAQAGEAIELTPWPTWPTLWLLGMAGTGRMGSCPLPRSLS